MSDYSWPDRPNETAFPVAKPGYPFIFAAAFATAVFALLGIVALALLGLLTTVFIVYFFRDPDRAVPSLAAAVVAPADGKVIGLETVDGGAYFDGECRKLSIFMSVFNVHVNRIPFEGVVRKVDYHPGKFVAANRDKASSDNERNALFIETQSGRPITVVQIAGLVARRIICRVAEGDAVAKGQRFGMICFGSRVDLYLPLEFDASVAVGDTVQSGTTILGELP
ncbi:MAG: phosphatidylserine decarboxylase [Deltaproteobacteria bacterium SG8_13]|nr:MAG: phosphatidylserine decarboxylase [Deltaproteobacteria bacterium SG8_13]